MLLAHSHPESHITSAMVRDDGSVHVSVDGKLQHAKHAPRNLTHIASDRDTVWVCDRKGRLFRWNGEFDSSEWTRVKNVPRLKSIFCDEDGKLCILSKRSKALIHNTDDDGKPTWTATSTKSHWAVPPPCLLPRVRLRTFIAAALLIAAILGPGRKCYRGFQRQHAADLLKENNVTLHCAHEFDAKGTKISAPDPGERWLRELFGRHHYVTPVEVLIGNAKQPVQGLEHFPSIRRARVKSYNQDEIDFLRQLSSLEELRIYNCKIKDLRVLAELPGLKTLRLGSSELGKLPSLAPLGQLTDFHVDGTPPVDLDFLRDLPNLKVLKINNNFEVPDTFTLAPIATLPTLEELTYNAVNLRRLHPSTLEPLQNMKRLHAGASEIKSLAWAADMKQLEYVWADEGKTKPIDHLQYGDQLLIRYVNEPPRQLWWDYATQPSIDDISSPKSILNVHLDYARIDNLDWIAELPKLERLYMANTQINSFPDSSASKLMLFDADDSHIRDVTGLENAPLVYRLRLSGTRVVDVAPLAKLPKLAVLTLARTDIKNLNGVAKFPNLSNLDISYCDIDSLAPLATSDSTFTTFTIDHTRVSDLTSLPRMVMRFSAVGCPIKDLSPLNYRVLTALNLSDTQIEDLSVLPNVLRLAELQIANTNVNSLAPLKQSRIVVLDASGTKIESIDALDNPKMTQLALARTAVQDFSRLTKMKELLRLDLSDTSFDEVPMLVKSCKDLIHLKLAGTPVKYISTLTDLQQLRELDLSRTSIYDFAPLRDLRALAMLDISDTSFSDCSNLPVDWGQDRTQRETLGIWPVTLNAARCDITDVSHLAKITQLAELNLAGNPIESFEPFREFLPYGLNLLDLRDSTIADLSPLSHLVGLRTLHANCESTEDLSPIAKLAVLGELTLQNLRPKHDLTPISQLEYLTRLEITGAAGDLTPLMQMRHLRELRLPEGTKLPEGFAKALPTLSSITIGDEIVMKKGLPCARP